MLGDGIWFVGQYIVQVYARNTNQNSLLLNIYQVFYWVERNSIDEEML